MVEPLVNVVSPQVPLKTTDRVSASEHVPEKDPEVGQLQFADQTTEFGVTVQ